VDPPSGPPVHRAVGRAGRALPLRAAAGHAAHGDSLDHRRHRDRPALGAARPHVPQRPARRDRLGGRAVLRAFRLDWTEIERALDEAGRGEPLRGASTITQQTAKNLFLWPGRNLLRKALEAWFALLMEALWPKSRILEVYLNVVEWEDGTYGVEAAARRHFHTSASRLTEYQAALLAAVLPNPRVYSTSKPSAFIRGRAATIRARMDHAQVTRKGVCR
jgi:hypothetical protein